VQGANRRPARQIVLTPQMLAQLLHLQHTTGFGDRRRVLPPDFGLPVPSFSRTILCRRTRNVGFTSQHHSVLNVFAGADRTSHHRATFLCIAAMCRCGLSFRDDLGMMRADGPANSM